MWQPMWLVPETVTTLSSEVRAHLVLTDWRFC